MISYSISEILTKVEKAQTKEEKVHLLKTAPTTVRDLLMGAYDDRIKWLLPEGPVPYKATPAVGQEGMLHQNVRTLYLFVEGGNPNLNQRRREALFVQLLESIDPKDAKLMEAVKDKKLLPEYKSITPELVKEAFPDWLVYTPKQNVVNLDSKAPVSDTEGKKKKTTKKKGIKEVT